MMFGYGLSAYASNSKVSIDVDGIALENVLKSIEQQTKYRFIYSKETINVNVPVTLKVKDEALTSVLDKLFATHGISYVIDKKQIVLNSRSTKVNKKDSASKGNKIKVLGIVSDPSGEPLIGASVRSDVSAVGVSTDIDGRYEIEVPAGSNILFSYVGYCSEKKKAEESGVLDVTLTEDSQLLSEVVVIGYGTMDTDVGDKPCWRERLFDYQFIRPSPFDSGKSIRSVDFKYCSSRSQQHLKHPDQRCFLPLSRSKSPYRN